MLTPAGGNMYGFEPLVADLRRFLLGLIVVGSDGVGAVLGGVAAWG